MVTITFVKFSGFNKLYALSQMQLAHTPLEKVSGLEFYKLMGSGAGNGFSIWPDWSTYCLLGMWSNEEDRRSFFEENEFWKNYTSKGKITQEFYVEPVKTHGSWDGGNPFKNNLTDPKEGKIVVLTRGLIKPKFIHKFWTQVPKASQPVPTSAGHIFSKGVGELPLIQQATVSAWTSKEAMYNYAYRNEKHQKVIKMTRDLGWYKEDMFTEFNLLKAMPELG